MEGIRGFSEKVPGLKGGWFLQSSPHGDQFLIYNEGEDFARLASEFAVSTQPFDIWFGQQPQEITGVDVAHIRRFEASRASTEIRRLTIAALRWSNCVLLGIRTA